MLTRTLKMLSGLVPFWRGAPERSVRNDSDRPCPTPSGCSSALDFIVDHHAWEWPGNPRIDRARAELKDLRAGVGVPSPSATDLDFIVLRHEAAEWPGDTAAAWVELKGLRAVARRLCRARADYRTCDTCFAFLVAAESTHFTCRRCRDARRVRHGPRPARASVAVGGVDISLPLHCPVAPGAKRPRTTVRLGAKQADALARILLKPGSDGMGIGFDKNDNMLMAGWHDRANRAVVELNVWRGDECDAVLTLSVAQAARLGEDIAECLAGCDHKFVDARNAVIESGEMCLKCGAIRAGSAPVSAGESDQEFWSSPGTSGPGMTC